MKKNEIFGLAFNKTEGYGNGQTHRNSQFTLDNYQKGEKVTRL